VKIKCRGACDNCCEDDVNYTFGTFPYNGGIVTRDCAWIIEAPQLVEKRRNRWCNKNVNGALVESKCPVACGDCSGNLLDTDEITLEGVKKIE
jgi:hypothetical protein